MNLRFDSAVTSESIACLATMSGEHLPVRHTVSMIDGTNVQAVIKDVCAFTSTTVPVRSGCFA